MFVKYAAAIVNGKAVQPSPEDSPSQNPLDFAVQSVVNAPPTPAPLPLSSQSSPPRAPSDPPVTWESGVMTVKGLTSFLLSTDNSAFADQHGKIYHDMTRPLPEYYISSSHNTYLVGHQLVGDSTIEGYIRALLHSCRSVERKVLFRAVMCSV